MFLPNTILIILGISGLINHQYSKKSGRPIFSEFYTIMSASHLGSALLYFYVASGIATSAVPLFAALWCLLASWGFAEIEKKSKF